MMGERSRMSLSRPRNSWCRGRPPVAPSPAAGCGDSGSSGASSSSVLRSNVAWYSSCAPAGCAHVQMKLLGLLWARLERTYEVVKVRDGRQARIETRPGGLQHLEHDVGLQAGHKMRHLVAHTVARPQLGPGCLSTYYAGPRSQEFQGGFLVHTEGGCTMAA